MNQWATSRPVLIFCPVRRNITQDPYHYKFHYTQFAYAYDQRSQMESIVGERNFTNENLTRAAFHHQSIMKMSSNEIQLTSGRSRLTSDITKQDYTQRDRYHLRTSSAIQVNLTLDEFKSSLSQMNLQDAMMYMSDNLFQPGLIKQTLQHDPDFLQRFDTYVQGYVQTVMTRDGKLDAQSMHLVHARSNLYRYLAELAPERANRPNFDTASEFPTRSDDALHQEQLYLFGLIELQQDTTFLCDLYYDYFLTLMARHKCLASDDRLWLTEALRAYLFLKNHALPPNIAELQYLQSQQTFKRLLQNIPNDHLIAALQPLLLNLGIPPKDYRMQGRYPNIQLVDGMAVAFTLQLESGQILNANNQPLAKALPSWLNDEHLSEFNLNRDVPCFISDDVSRIEFITSTQSVRFIHDNKVWCQKKWGLNGDEGWYTQVSLSDSTIFEHDLPACFMDKSIKSWINSDGNVLLTENDKPIYQSNPQGEWQQIDTPYTLASSNDERLTTFEDPAYYYLNYDETQQQGQVDFMRYGLLLTINQSKITLPSTNYVLESPKTSPFDPMVSCLTFNDGIHQQCYVAVHPVIVDKQAQLLVGDFYPLKHDSTGAIKRFNYKITETYVCYPIIDGEPKPQCSADALYLCYLYLMTHKTDKAWAILDKFNHQFSFEGSAREMNFLNAILDALPPNQKLATPPYIACQLKILALFTDRLDQGKSFTLPSNKQSLEADDEETQEETKNTLDGYAMKVLMLYQQLLRMKRHLPVQYTLSTCEARRVLNLAASQKGNLGGSLGYESERLNLTVIYQEYLNLLAAYDTANQKEWPLPVGYEARLIEVNKILNLPDSFLFRTPESIPHQIPRAVLYQKRRPGVVAYNVPDFNLGSSFSPAIIPHLDDSQMSHALEKLDRFFSPTESLAYVLHFVRIALTQNHPSRALLEKRCIQFLKADLIEHDANEDALLNNVRLMFHILKHTDELAEHVNKDEVPLTLETVVEALKHCAPSPPVMIRQMINQSKMLADVDTLLNVVKREAHISVPIQSTVMSPPEPPLMETLVLSTGASLSSQRAQKLNRLIKRYQFTERQETLQIKTLQLSTDSVSVHDEKAVGLFKYQRIQSQRKLAKLHLFEPEIREALLQNTIQLEQDLRQILSLDWNKTLELANRPPPDSRQALHLQLEIAAQQRKKLTQDDLLKLYMHADVTLYRSMTHLTELNDINALHEMIKNNLSKEIKRQQLNRLTLALGQITEPPTEAELYQIATLFMASNHPTAQADPRLMLFQYYENMLLRPVQIDALNALLSTPHDPFRYQELVEKIIMGGGKSKVILPLLAQAKANGVNLVIIEVPRALLWTNHADLNATSQRLFGQRAFIFDFSRDTECSPKHLQTIYKHFMDVINNKAYLVTTGEAMQSLELKYIELLLNRPKPSAPPNETEVWKTQVMWLARITRTIRQSSSVIIDEVHQGLHLKREVNYTLGEKTPISSELIHHSVDFYQFIDVLELERGAAAFTTSMGFDFLADQLMDHPQSPLQTIIKSWDPSLQEELRAYLKNNDESERISQLPIAIKDTIAFYKTQTTLFPQTASRRHKADYGPFHSMQETPSKQAVAIPYSANNKPNETSRFGDPLETMNYTSQSLRIDGLSAPLLRQLIVRWQSDALQEWTINYPKYKRIEDTPKAQKWASLFDSTRFKLQEIDINNSEQVESCLRHLKHPMPIIYEVLQKDILPEIMVEPSILRSDVYNHADMFHNLQALSGTPTNHSTYHSRLSYNLHTSLGTDYYLQEVLKGKDTPLHGIAFTTIRDFLTQVFAQLKKPLDVRAFIDVNATFSGIAHLDVALALVDFINTNRMAIQYVLYFNDDDILCAVNTQDPNKRITLDTSDPLLINQKLNCQPEQRMTYYDQAHRYGTDLKQAPQANAVVLVDEQTHTQDFLQSCMRMRGLEDDQTVEIVTPQVAPGQTLESLMEQMQENEDKQLAMDNFYATVGKMSNQLRRKMLDLIATLDPYDANRQHKWLTASQRFFVNHEDFSLYHRYGAMYKKRDTKEILEQQRDQLLNDWQACLILMDQPVNETELTQERALMDGIIQVSLPFCQAQSISALRGPCEKTVEKQKQKETEKKKQQEQLKEKMHEVEIKRTKFLSDIKQHQPWESLNLLQFALEKPSSVTLTSLNEACGLANETQAIQFSPHVLVSSNYSSVYNRQTEMMGPYLNPTQAILYRLHNNQLMACLINNQEADEIYHALPIKYVWMESTQKTVLAGERPLGVIDTKEYQLIIEQIRFFGGKWFELTRQEEPLLWISEQPQDKLTFFEKKMLPFREISNHAFEEIAPVILDKLEKQSLMDDANYATISMTDNSTAQSRILSELMFKATVTTTEEKVTSIDYRLDEFLQYLQQIPEERRLAALMEQDENGQQLLELVSYFPDAFSNLLTMLPSDDQLQAITAIRRDKSITWPLAYDFPNLVHALLETVPPELRYDTLMAQDSDNETLFQRAFKNPNTLRVMLALLPEQDQIKLLMARNKTGQTSFELALGINKTLSFIKEQIGELNWQSIATKYNVPSPKSHYSWRNRVSYYDMLTIDKMNGLGANYNIAIGYRNTFNYYLKHWPDTWTDLLPIKKRIIEKAMRDQANCVVILNHVSPDARFELLTHFASCYENDLALDLAMDYPDTFKRLLLTMNEQERLKTLEMKNEYDVSLLDNIREKPELLRILLDALPAWEHHRVFIDQYGNNQLHLAVKDKSTFAQILNQIPAEFRWGAVMEKNKLGQSIVDLAIEIPDIFQLIDEGLTENERPFLTVDHEGNTALHKAAQDPIRLQTLIESAPSPHRMTLLSKKNNHGESALSLVQKNPSHYEKLLDSLSESERHKTFTDPESGISMDTLKQRSYGSRDKTLLIEIAQKIMRTIPPKYRFEAVIYGWKDPHIRSSLVSFLTPGEQFQLHVDEHGNNRLMQLADKSWDVFNAVLQTLPPDERLKPLLSKNSSDEMVFDRVLKPSYYACSAESITLTKLLQSLPDEQHVSAIQIIFSRLYAKIDITRFQVLLAELTLNERLIALLAVIKCPLTPDLTKDIKFHLNTIIHELEAVVEPIEKLQLALLRQALSKEIQPVALAILMKEIDDLMGKHMESHHGLRV